MRNWRYVLDAKMTTSLMKTLHLHIAPGQQAAEPAIREAAAIIRRGGLVAFPTETVYGLGANALDREAVLRIFAAKQRPAWDPIIVHVCSLAMAERLVTAWPAAALKLAERFMPGPLTLLLPKRDIVPDVCTAGRDKVGIRIPAHPVALALIEAAGVPIAAPSANRFGAPSPTTVSHVQRDLGGRIDAILDAGPVAGRRRVHGARTPAPTRRSSTGPAASAASRSRPSSARCSWHSAIFPMMLSRKPWSRPASASVTTRQARRWSWSRTSEKWN